VTLNAFAHYYDFRLTSNFTYFLDDPVDGDEFQQLDRRVVFGGSARTALDTGLGKVRLGLEARTDVIDRVGLFASVDGRRTGAVRDDSVDEASVGAFAELETKLAERLRLVLGLRGDVYGYTVRSDLAANSGSGTDGILLPKAALAWQAVPGTLELYANYGESFHSNDVRGATIAVDPASGDPADAVPVLVRARGAELGARVEARGLTASLVGFWLELDSELVFVGDAGATEPNDATRRFGVEGTLFWRPTPTLAIDAAATYTDARFSGVSRAVDRIPGAVENVVSAGVSWTPLPPFTATLRLRHFGSAPLIEDDSQRSDGTTLVNLGGYYDLGRRTRIAVEALNLFDSRDNDITYFYASRLPGEPAEGVEDRHLHPVEPFQLRVSLRQRF
jgi:outer membrane receptor protein involved in Fe transport